MTSKELALLSLQILSEKKAVDPLALYVEEHCSFTDYLVIASGNSERQVSSLAAELEDRLAEEYEILSRSIEGKGGSGWILMDFGDIIVHIFDTENRALYDLERIWRDGKSMDPAEFTK
jgi:ribosome-associated protein